MARRVVITGIGLITPLGLNVKETWDALTRGESGIAHITRFDVSAFAVRIAGEVKGFDPLKFMEKRDLKKMDIFIHYALAATEEALNDSSLPVTDETRNRIGVIIGSGIGGFPMIETQLKELLARGPDRVSPFFIPSVIVNMASGMVSIRYGIKGPNVATCTACSTGAHAIGDAFNAIRRSDADAMIAGGTESAICSLTVAGFASMKALSRRNDDPQRASRPFDRDRDGFVLGEGAGIVVLEEYEKAKQRGANIYAELLGYGMSGDAYHITAPPDDGDGAVRAMSEALRNAGVSADKIDYINAHGTSTPHGDEIETLAIKRVFGDHAKKLLVSSTKSMMGHLLGAAGSVETSICTLAIKHGVVPPTMNLDNPDEGCDLNYVPKESVRRPVNYALNNSFGFGGTNACLVMKKI